jgi:hypothetical protein
MCIKVSCIQRSHLRNKNGLHSKKRYAMLEIQAKDQSESDTLAKYRKMYYVTDTKQWYVLCNKFLIFAIENCTIPLYAIKV